MEEKKFKFFSYLVTPWTNADYLLDFSGYFSITFR